MKLSDSKIHGKGSGAELFIVEGDSASRSVNAVRDEKFQAVLPMQGKPLNAWKATGSKVAENALFQQLAAASGLPSAIELPPDRLDHLRFEHVFLLFDPDADGIHCGALMLMYFYRYLPALIERERLHLVRAPTAELTVAGQEEVFQAYSPEHQARLHAHFQKNGPTEVQVRPYRGLSSLDPQVLRSACIDPQSRHIKTLAAQDAQEAVAVFGQ